MGKRISRYGLLLALCWMVYTCSLIGKLNYSANITQVMEHYGVLHDEAGMVSTFYFFAYGAGQIVNGLLCKKYRLKYVVFLGLLLSGGANLCVALTKNFAVVKYMWLLNGIGLSVLWPCLIRLLSETLPRKDMGRASVIMGTTTATGTFLIYGLSALFAAWNAFKTAFYLAAIVLPIVGFVWLFSYDKLAIKEADDDETIPSVASTLKEPQKKERGVIVCVCVLALFAIATNLIKDGLTTWVPSILKETYGLSDSLSLLLTLFLPVLAIFGNLIALQLYKKIHDFVAVCGLLFLGITVLIGTVIGFLSTGSFGITVAAFSVVCCFASSANSTITSIFPLQMKGKINSGMIAGVLNGCCYVGSTVSSYGLGSVRTVWGWNAVLYLLLFVAVAAVGISLAYVVVRIFKKKRFVRISK